MKYLLGTCLVFLSLLTGCSTAVAVADTAASAAIYAGKTAVNVLDAVTPDIVNKD
jgi:hypothetical protein